MRSLFRAHNLLNTGDGTAAFKWCSTGIDNETKNGRPIYNWTNVDRIIDTCRHRVRNTRHASSPRGHATSPLLRPHKSGYAMLQHLR
ncbi:hypothetical protein ASE95_16200 [Sphingomonas sp. Leaf231]|nr:hypothetical protein ASE95_16200 [Sphingomonas sp. Leaf231]